ncbi:16S rRNA (uracil(1498)-N(3))-methyltransferase [soil metagenome]
MRIFVEPGSLTTGEVSITGEEHHYIGRVRRVRVGQSVELVDGAGRRATAKIVRMTEAETFVEVAEVTEVIEAAPHVRVLVPLIKGDRMDGCLEKLTEVGASELMVWQAERSVVRLDAAKREARVAHYAGVVEAAARQCGRARIPQVRFTATLREVLRALPVGDRFVLDPTAERGEPSGAADVTVISGPEGGFSWIELDQLAAAGFLALGLGPRVLRADTAPVVAVALIRAATAS